MADEGGEVQEIEMEVEEPEGGGGGGGGGEEGGEKQQKGREEAAKVCIYVCICLSCVVVTVWPNGLECLAGIRNVTDSSFCLLPLEGEGFRFFATWHSSKIINWDLA